MRQISRHRRRVHPVSKPARRSKLSEKAFRVHAKRFFLSYSRVPEGLSKEMAATQLQEKIGVNRYVLGAESQADGGKHFHAVFLSDKKKDIRYASKFDLEFDGKAYKGHYEKVSDLKGLVRYICKGGDYITNMDEVVDGDLMSASAELIKRSFEIGIDAVLQEQIKSNPDKLVSGKSIVQMKKGLRVVHGVVGRVTEPDRSLPCPAFTLKDFQLTDVIKEWIGNGYQPTLIIVGPAGAGKTQFARALPADLGMKIHVVNHVQGLKDLQKFHNVIIYDDFSGQDLDIDGWLAVFETEQPRRIRVLRDSIRKPEGLIQIMTLNKESFNNISYIVTPRPVL